MKSYTLTEARNRHGEVFDHAMIEPVILTKQSRPSYVVLSVHAYEHLLDRISQLEDVVWGQAAEQALQQSQMMSSDRFVTELEKLANG